MLSVTVTSPEALQTLLGNLSKAQGSAVGELAGKLAAPGFSRALVEQSQELAGSGPFSSGWLAQPATAGLSVTNNSPQARVIELPTSPHQILPRPGTHTVTRTSKKGKVFSYQAPNMLAWMPGRRAFSAAYVKPSTKSGQTWIFAKKVNHPGTPGKHVFKTTVTNRASLIFDALANAARNILGG